MHKLTNPAHLWHKLTNPAHLWPPGTNVNHCHFLSLPFVAQLQPNQPLPFALFPMQCMQHSLAPALALYIQYRRRTTLYPSLRSFTELGAICFIC